MSRSFDRARAGWLEAPPRVAAGDPAASGTARVEPAAAGNGLAIEFASDTEQLQRLLPAWSGLMDRCADADLFAAPSWHAAWWRAFGAGRAPRVIGVRRHGVLVGVMPLCRYRDALRGWPVRVIGSYNNEHASRTGLLVVPGEEEAVCDAVAQCLASQAPDWDVLMLRQLPEAARWLSPLRAAFERHGLTGFAPRPGVGKCVLDLASGWQGYVEARGNHFRKRLKGNRNRLARLGELRFRRSNGGLADFEEFERLEASSWKSGDGEARLGADGWRFQQEVARSDDSGIRCHNLFLELNGTVVGALHAVRFRGVAYSMQTLFDESVRNAYAGRILFGAHVEDMFGDPSLQRLDLNGNSAFCTSWTDQELGFVNLQVYHRRPYSALLAMLKRVAGRQ